MEEWLLPAVCEPSDDAGTARDDVPFDAAAAAPRPRPGAKAAASRHSHSPPVGAHDASCRPRPVASRAGRTRPKSAPVTRTLQEATNPIIAARAWQPIRPVSAADRQRQQTAMRPSSEKLRRARPASASVTRPASPPRAMQDGAGVAHARLAARPRSACAVPLRNACSMRGPDRIRPQSAFSGLTRARRPVSARDRVVAYGATTCGGWSPA